MGAHGQGRGAARRRGRRSPRAVHRSGDPRRLAPLRLPELATASVTGLSEYAVPVLPSRDLRETLAFYERLGFESRGAPPEKWEYLILARGGIELHFFAAPDTDPLTTASGCYIRVPDADALHADWREAGVEPDRATGSRLQPPTDTEWGMREFALVDRSGNLVRVGSPLRS